MKARLRLLALLCVRIGLTALVGFVVGVAGTPAQLLALTLIPFAVDLLCAYTIYTNESGGYGERE